MPVPATMDVAGRPAILPVLWSSMEDACWLLQARRAATRAPHTRLRHVQRIDERLMAHLEVLAVAGTTPAGAAGVRQALQSNPGPTAGAIFTGAIQCLEAQDRPDLNGLFAVAALQDVSDEAERGLIGAFSWVSAPALQCTIRVLLASTEPLQRRVALAACAMHRVDPGPALDAACAAEDDALRARAFRVAGEVGRVELLPLLQAAVSRDGEPATPRFWAARSAVLLGGRDLALAWLATLAEGAAPFSDAAAELSLKALDLPTAHQHLRHCAAQTKADTPAAAQARRRLIRRCGIVGDPHLIPWLIAQMTDLRLTRLAGEAFSMITGADLAWLDLDRKPPAGIDFGPNDDPEDDNVAMDEDDGLPWPDPDKVQAWWHAQQHRFPAGHRFFIGELPSPAHALKVLRDGFQRQRIAAAQWACLLTPGTKLFPTAAPAWRQQRWLAAMG